MGKRGPKKGVNLERRWWSIHKITLKQLHDLVNECKRQLPLLENSINEPMVMSALVAEKSKLVNQDLFDASEFIRSFNPDDFPDDDEEEVATTGAAAVEQQHGPRNEPGS